MNAAGIIAGFPDIMICEYVPLILNKTLVHQSKSNLGQINNLLLKTSFTAKLQMGSLTQAFDILIWHTWHNVVFFGLKQHLLHTLCTIFPLRVVLVPTNYTVNNPQVPKLRRAPKKQLISKRYWKVIIYMMAENTDLLIFRRQVAQVATLVSPSLIQIFQ